ncbi:YhcN/YlaJ family sporulation lipoprotein [Fredinandcohnia quinoae]|uniref:YhcN/YlaJ family sporulation lipoprotein n=1 Tax=Fredinandcohnia quinoae TaxID=2918902 RepID=A0AAW5E477_9BACI|nr:YhcN/YlaJ family sporulation lipoprotein [Fredinandcohnia sp. SECRCQ15]MCH1623928.1 YhcN/YlaJ family sporulation lipoprotein [Fredinandcohnia sp. SECRCQ15]
MKTTRILLFCFLTISLAGCGFNDKENVQDNEKENRIQVKNTVDNHIDKKSGQEIANHLVELASSVPNVNDATAVVVGKFAVVGIDVNSKLDRSRVSTIKYSVTESLQHDPYGANAIVFADADTYERLKQMKKEIQDGRPITGILDELAQIVGRVMPDIPTEIIDNQNTNPTKTNDKQLNQNELDKLKKEQKDQSNNKKND